MNTITHSTEKVFDWTKPKGREQHFLDMSKSEQEEQNEFDLREIKQYYGDWDQVRKLIDRLEDNDNEAAYERYSSRQ